MTKILNMQWRLKLEKRFCISGFNLFSQQFCEKSLQYQCLTLSSSCHTDVMLPSLCTCNGSDPRAKGWYFSVQINVAKVKFTFNNYFFF